MFYMIAQTAFFCTDRVLYNAICAKYCCLHTSCFLDCFLVSTFLKWTQSMSERAACILCVQYWIQDCFSDACHWWHLPFLSHPQCYHHTQLHWHGQRFVLSGSEKRPNGRLFIACCFTCSLFYFFAACHGGASSKATEGLNSGWRFPLDC